MLCNKHTFSRLEYIMIINLKKLFLQIISIIPLYLAIQSCTYSDIEMGMNSRISLAAGEEIKKTHVTGRDGHETTSYGLLNINVHNSNKIESEGENNLNKPKNFTVTIDELTSNYNEECNNLTRDLEKNVINRAEYEIQCIMTTDRYITKYTELQILTYAGGNIEKVYNASITLGDLRKNHTIKKSDNLTNIKILEELSKEYKKDCDKLWEELKPANKQLEDKKQLIYKEYSPYIFVGGICILVVIVIKIIKRQ